MQALARTSAKSLTLKHVYEPRAPSELREAWLRKDRTIERDAADFWRANHLLPDGVFPDERFGELCMAAYDGASLIALTTARIRFIGFLGVKLVMLRVAVAPDKRQNRLATIIQAESRELLERWSAENPEQEVMGMGTVTQTHLFDERGPARGLLRSSHLAFIGWTANGEHMRVAWFDHGRIPRTRPEPKSSSQDGF